MIDDVSIAPRIIWEDKRRIYICIKHIIIFYAQFRKDPQDINATDVIYNKTHINNYNFIYLYRQTN